MTTLETWMQEGQRVVTGLITGKIRRVITAEVGNETMVLRVHIVPDHMLWSAVFRNDHYEVNPESLQPAA